jgi:hypothetical protein
MPWPWKSFYRITRFWANLHDTMNLKGPKSGGTNWAKQGTALSLWSPLAAASACWRKSWPKHMLFYPELLPFRGWWLIWPGKWEPPIEPLAAPSKP